MHPDDSLELLLESLRNDISLVGHSLRDIARRVIEEGISEYPIFVAAQDWMPIGKPLFDRESVQLNWYFFASLLEEFVSKGLIPEQRVPEFRRTYGDPEHKACIFLVTPEDARFVFVAYDETAESEEI